MGQLATKIFRSAQFVFIGRTGKDAEIRYFDNGGSKAKTRIAISQGKDEEAEWFTVEAWDDAAAILADVPKGAFIKVTGRVTQEHYTKRSGEKGSDDVIKASAVEVLPQRERQGNGQQPASAAPRPRQAVTRNGGAATPTNPPVWNSGPLNGEEEDLIPF